MSKPIDGLARKAEYYCPSCERVKFFGDEHYTASMPVSQDLEGAVIRRCFECYSGKRAAFLAATEEK